MKKDGKKINAIKQSLHRESFQLGLLHWLIIMLPLAEVKNSTVNLKTNFIGKNEYLFLILLKRTCAIFTCFKSLVL